METNNATKLSEIIMKMYSYVKGVDLEKINVLAKEFETNIEYYIQKPKVIYSLPFKVNENIYDCKSIISRCYTHTIFDILFVEYNEYIILLVRGSNE